MFGVRSIPLTSLLRLRGGSSWGNGGLRVGSYSQVEMWMSAELIYDRVVSLGYDHTYGVDRRTVQYAVYVCPFFLFRCWWLLIDAL